MRNIIPSRITQSGPGREMTSNPSPRISVVIPTRERCDTLVSTLQTCLDQDYANCEIIVSDNFSQDDTREIVASSRDARVRYINPGRRLSMSHHWEFALAQVRGDYVTYVGDDDGLLPGALSALAAIVQRTGTKAISWAWASYFWPNCVHSPSRNLLLVPSSRGLEVRSAPRMLREVLQFRRGYEQLPFFYKGIVSTGLIDRVKEASGGSFFHSMIPDVYSAIALSLLAEDYHYSHQPYSVNGTSFHSNGAAQLDPTSSAARAFLAEGNIPFHSEMVLAPSTSILVGETFLQARDRIKCSGDYSVSVAKMLEAAMRETASAPPERYAQVCNAVRAMSIKHGLADRVEALLDSYPNRPNKTPIGLTEGFNVVNRMQVINCSKFGVRNIHQAANLCGAVMHAGELGFVRNPVSVAGTTAVLAKGALWRALRSRLLGS